MTEPHIAVEMLYYRRPAAGWIPVAAPVGPGDRLGSVTALLARRTIVRPARQPTTIVYGWDEDRVPLLWDAADLSFLVSHGQGTPEGLLFDLRAVIAAELPRLADLRHGPVQMPGLKGHLRWRLMA